MAQGTQDQGSEETQPQGMNIAAPVQKVVQVGLGQVASSLDAALATLDALEDIPYHAADTGLGLVHNTFETAIQSLRQGLQQAAQDAQTAVQQVGGVTTVGGGGQG